MPNDRICQFWIKKKHIYLFDAFFQAKIIFKLPYTKRQFLIDTGLGTPKTVGNYLISLEEKGYLTSVRVGKEKLYLNHKLMEVLENDWKHEYLTSATSQVRQQWFSVGIFPPGLLFGLTGNRPQSAPACSFLRYRHIGCFVDTLIILYKNQTNDRRSIWHFIKSYQRNKR